MLKSLGLGICCLTLSISGVTRASILPIDGGKYGDDKCFKIEDPCKKIEDPCKTDKNVCDFKGDLDNHPILDKILCDLGKDKDKDCKDIKCDIKDDKNCDDKGDKDHKDVCKVDLKCHDHLLCDIIEDHGNNHCDVKVDHCDFIPCGHDNHDPHGCIPVAVPAPASAAFGGLGIAGIMAMVGLRSRRSVKA